MAVKTKTSGEAKGGRPLSENKMTVDGHGHILFSGLAAGTYTLTETDTKDGYNKLTDTITVKITEDGTVTAYYTSKGSTAGAITVTPASKGEDNAITPARFTIENRAGTVLPSTGGGGTTMLYVIGILLISAAGGMWIVLKKRRAA